LKLGLGIFFDLGFEIFSISIIFEISIVVSEGEILAIQQAAAILTASVCLFVPSLSFYREKATVALYLGRIRTR